MQRDMDLIRKILLTIAESESAWAPDPLVIEGYTAEQIGYHSLLLVESGLVEGQNNTTTGEPSGYIARLNWNGHEFLESAREPTRWQEAKGIVEKAGFASLQVWQAVLTDLTLRSLGMK
jgi:hypothetical protein